jgi:hypothetical protein
MTIDELKTAVEGMKVEPHEQVWKGLVLDLLKVLYLHKTRMDHMEKNMTLFRNSLVETIQEMKKLNRLCKEK